MPKVVVFLVSIASLVACAAPPRPHGEAEVLDPRAFTTPHWDEALGGDSIAGPEALTLLNDPQRSDLAPSDQQAVREVARATALAELTGVGQDDAAYWPLGPPPPSDRCDAVTIEAISPMVLPVREEGWAKVLVVWTGQCPYRPPGDPHVLTIYAKRHPDGWRAVREAHVPGANRSRSALVLPSSDELSPLPCGNSELLVRFEVAYALEEMCADAAESSVSVGVTDAWRSPQTQADRFQAAVTYYGGDAEARRHVAYSNGVECHSRHCAGVALDVDGETLAWLSEGVGCADLAGGVDLRRTSCSDGEVAVKRMVLYGLTQPLPDLSTHLEFAGALASETCGAPPGAPIPTVIAATWRCELAASGLPAGEKSRVVAEALVVSRCASGWDPAAIEYGGRYVVDPNPATGDRAAGSGLFSMAPAVADLYVPGGAAALTDTFAASAGAARAWLAERQSGRWGWGPFACATGSPGVAPVLDRQTPDALPAWAWQY